MNDLIKENEGLKLKTFENVQHCLIQRCYYDIVDNVIGLQNSP